MQVAARALATGSIGVGSYGLYRAREDMGPDSLNRLLSFYSVAIPMVIEYKTLEMKCEKLPIWFPSLFDTISQEEETKLFEPLHEKWKQPLVDKLMELGGFFYKNGQRGAGNMGGFVPQIYQDACQPFLDSIPPRDFKNEIIPIILNEYNINDINDVFISIDENPIGCASIGQVHRAIIKKKYLTSNSNNLLNIKNNLTEQEEQKEQQNKQYKNKKDNNNKADNDGDEQVRVVIKIQDPNAERTFRGDVFALKSICAMFFPQGLPAFEEMEKQFQTEFDYRREALNSIEIYNNLKNNNKIGNKFNHILIPIVYPYLCTKKVLVMEEIYPSVPLIRALEDQASQMAKQQGFKGTTKEFMAMEKEKQLKLEMEAAEKGKLIDSVDASTMSKYIAYQQSKAQLLSWLSYPIKWLGFSTHNKNNEEEEDTNKKDSETDVFIPINLPQIMDELLYVHGYEVLINGCFNGDPHPGNILYISPQHNSSSSKNSSSKSRHKLGLIDYGQVKRIDDEFRLKMAKTFLLTEAAMEFDPRSLKENYNKNVENINMKYNNKLKNKTHKTIDYEKTHKKAITSLSNHMMDIGFKSEKMLPSTMYEMCTIYYGRHDRAWLYPLNYLQWSDKIQSEDPLGDLTEVKDAVMITMTGLYLIGFGHAIQQPRNLSKEWSPLAKQALAEANKLNEVEEEILNWITMENDDDSDNNNEDELVK